MGSINRVQVRTTTQRGLRARGKEAVGTEGGAGTRRGAVETADAAEEAQALGGFGTLAAAPHRHPVLPGDQALGPRLA